MLTAKAKNRSQQLKFPLLGCYRGWSPGLLPHGCLDTLVVSMSGHWTPPLCPWSPVSYLRKNSHMNTSHHIISPFVLIHPKECSWCACIPGMLQAGSLEQAEKGWIQTFSLFSWHGLVGLFLYLEGKFLVSSRLISDSWLNEKGRLFILVGGICWSSCMQPFPKAGIMQGLGCWVMA